MIEWRIKPTNELTKQEKNMLAPVDERSSYYVWVEKDHKVLASVTLINLPVGFILNLADAQESKYRLAIMYRLFGIISRIDDPKPTVILNPISKDDYFYHDLGFAKKGNTYTRTIEL